MFLRLLRNGAEYHFWEFRNSEWDAKQTGDPESWKGMWDALQKIRPSYRGKVKNAQFIEWIDDVSRYSFRAGYLIRNLPDLDANPVETANVRRPRAQR